MRIAAIATAWVLATGCFGNDDNRLEVLVDALVVESGSLATQAENALVARGRDSIVVLETGLYRATPHGRRRIIRTLARIGHPDARPVLAHLHRYDSDEDVREAAARAMDRMNTGGEGKSK
ncbi:MAG: HEAT repeat domain-containing protein [Deltaproteobacteria bacterium]|nr:HEAT repeat domain-containing protein [Deltaproteobacteria bacterium]